MQTYEILFDITGEVVIPACNFDFATNSTCWPRVEVLNPNAFEDQPVLTVFQNGVPTFIKPTDRLAFDRSVGELKVTIGPYSAAKFSVSVVVDMPYALKPDVSGSLGLEARMETYARLAELRSLFDASSVGTGTDEMIAAKTAATTIHILSASAVAHGYHYHLADLVRGRAKDIAAANSTAKDVADVVFAADIMTPKEIDDAITRVNTQMSKVHGKDRSELKLLLKELQKAKQTAIIVAGRVKVFHDHYFNELDRWIAEYQGLVLELAQFYPDAALSAAAGIPAERIAAIQRKIKSNDVLILNDALSNRGAAIRKSLRLAPTFILRDAGDRTSGIGASRHFAAMRNLVAIGA